MTSASANCLGTAPGAAGPSSGVEAPPHGTMVGVQDAFGIVIFASSGSRRARASRSLFSAAHYDQIGRGGSATTARTGPGSRSGGAADA